MLSKRAKAIKILRLRVYVKSASTNTTDGHTVFYRWRADGPFFLVV
jgi:hypothetical protein